MADKVQAKDIDDAAVLAAITSSPRARAGGIGVDRWEIGVALGAEFPEKVVLAKLRSMVKRGLISGCACGCRGDFNATPRHPEGADNVKR